MSVGQTIWANGLNDYSIKFVLIHMPPHEENGTPFISRLVIMLKVERESPSQYAFDGNFDFNFPMMFSSMSIY